MRDSTFRVLEAVAKGPKSWSELVRLTGLTEPGLFKILAELKRTKIITEIKISTTGVRTKRYAMSDEAKALRIYPTAKLLKKKLEKLNMNSKNTLS